MSETVEPRWRTARRSRALRRCGGLVLSALLVGAGAARAQSFSANETVLAVEIPVQVLKDGRPVEGLGRDDFEVRDQGDRQPIVDFDVVDLAVGHGGDARLGPLGSPLAAAGRRYFLFLFDLTNSEPAAMARARVAVRRLANEVLHPADLAAVATWSARFGPKLIVGFTTDRSQVSAAIETLGLIDPLRKRSDPLGLMLTDIERSSPETAPLPNEDALALSNSREEAVMAGLAALSYFERGARRSERASEIGAFTSGVTELARVVANVVGRKYVVLLSQGFDSRAILGQGDEEAERSAADASMAGEIWRIDSEERYGSTRLGNEFEKMLATLRSADCTIEAVDIGGMLPSGNAIGRRPPGRETLLTMALDTGGALFENFNDLSAAMERVLRATSVTYVLTIEPRALKPDGRFHDLRVRLKRKLDGARLSHRPGYFAPLPFEERSLANRQVETAQLLLTGEPGGRLEAGVAAVAFPGDARRAHVPVILEVAGPTVLRVSGAARVPLAAYAYAFDQSGAITDFVAQSFELEREQVAERLSSGPVKFAGDLLLPPGRYLLRALLRVGERGEYWIGELDLTVPDLPPQKLAVASPLFPEPMSRGLVVRSAASSEKAAALPFPFVLGEEFFLPSALPRWRRAEAHDLALTVYGLESGEATIEGELLAADGSRVAKLGVAVTRRRGATRGFDRFSLRVDAANAPPGRYLLRLGVSQSERSASGSARIELVP